MAEARATRNILCAFGDTPIPELLVGSTLAMVVSRLLPWCAHCCVFCCCASYSATLITMVSIIAARGAVSEQEHQDQRQEARFHCAGPSPASYVGTSLVVLHRRVTAEKDFAGGSFRTSLAATETGRLCTAATGDSTVLFAPIIVEQPGQPLLLPCPHSHCISLSLYKSVLSTFLFRLPSRSLFPDAVTFGAVSAAASRAARWEAHKGFPKGPRTQMMGL